MVDRLELEEPLAFPLARRVVMLDRVRPAVAGAISGALGGVAMAFLTDALMGRGAQAAHPFLDLLAGAFRGLDPTTATVVGVGLLALAASLVGGTFAKLTRRLKKLFPLVVWMAVVSGALWILLDAFFVSHLPSLAARLPFAHVLAGTEAFAIVLALHLPFRLRRAAVEVPDLDEAV